MSLNDINWKLIIIFLFQEGSVCVVYRVTCMLECLHSLFSPNCVSHLSSPWQHYHGDRMSASASNYPDASLNNMHGALFQCATHTHTYTHTYTHTHRQPWHIDQSQKRAFSGCSERSWDGQTFPHTHPHTQLLVNIKMWVRTSVSGACYLLVSVQCYWIPPCMFQDELVWSKVLR